MTKSKKSAFSHSLTSDSNGKTETFKSIGLSVHNDIIGRIGGDEFCIYMKDILSVNLVKQKCRQLADVACEVLFKV